MVPIALIREQAESARVWLEDFDCWPVNLPDLPEFLEAIKGSSFEEILASFPMVQRWFIQSIRRHIGAVKTDDDTDFDDSADSTEWIDLYRAADSEGALGSITQRLARTKFRWITARLYNDRGYIEYPDDPSTAKADLGRALDLHYQQLPLTLLNLAIVAIDEGDYQDAIRLLNYALFLTRDREFVPASHLRIRLMGTHLAIASQEKWEQHPANVLEAAYVNLAYALAHAGDEDAARDSLSEGLELMPSSVWLGIALARFHLSRKRADLADPVYEELSSKSISDARLRSEAQLYLTKSRRKPASSKRRQRR